jgi:UDP-N-acetylmuramate dehydrogenase
MISKKHANFIINTGDAKAQDIIDLVYLARQKVKEIAGVELEPEIRVVGR